MDYDKTNRTVYLVEYGFFDPCGFVAYVWKHKGTELKKLFASLEEAESYIKEEFGDFKKDLYYEDTGSQIYVQVEEPGNQRGVLITPLKL